MVKLYMRKFYRNINIFIVVAFLFATSLSTATLFSARNVSATDPSVVDDINITVPVSCSLSGTGMDTHITELHNTESDSSIGESTITAYCNDLNGFSIYAVGFTNNEYGNNNLVSVTASTTNTIPTGTNTSGNTSSWAMKLTPITNPTPTYPITIIGSTDDTDKTPTTLDYTSFQSVPNEYALVARRKASTDVGTNAEGSSFKTTYQAYAASGQAAGTYEGQVRYTLVHPYNHAVPDPPSFKVLYTGRPLSTEPGHENPVTVLMSDLPADGKYNLLGTADGQYDKLTPDTLYGGYYKDVVDSIEDFSYTNEVDYYDGTNFNWLVSTPETTDAAEITPEEGVTYYVKEVNSEAFLRNNVQWTKSGNTIMDIWFFTCLDDANYETTGFDITINGETDITYPVNIELSDSFIIIPTSNPNNSFTVTPSNFNANGDNNRLGVWRDFDYEIMNNEVESFSMNAIWVTKDGYKINGHRKRNVRTNGWQNNAISSTIEIIPITITKWHV